VTVDVCESFLNFIFVTVSTYRGIIVYLSTCEPLTVAWKQIGHRDNLARQWIVGFVTFDT